MTLEMRVALGAKQRAGCTILGEGAQLLHPQCCMNDKTGSHWKYFPKLYSLFAQLEVKMNEKSLPSVDEEQVAVILNGTTPSKLEVCLENFPWFSILFYSIDISACSMVVVAHMGCKQSLKELLREAAVTAQWSRFHDKEQRKSM